MRKLWFVQEVPSIELAARRKGKIKTSAVLVVGMITVLLVGAAIALFILKQPEAGRLVIDVALAFFSWSSGRTIGELAGVAKG